MSFFSKLKLKTGGGATPLDDIMNNSNRSDDEDDGVEKDVMQLQVQEMNNFAGSREARERRETGEMRETMEIHQMREMQRYVILEQKIQGIQNNMNEIKKNQELILSILEKKFQ